MDEISYLTISDVAQLYRTRRVSPVEAVDATPRENRVSSSPTFHAFITVTPEVALAAARKAEAELMKDSGIGPLHGIPVAHKDVFLTRGVRTTGHCRPFMDYIPGEDAEIVSQWEASGAVTLGKTNTYELASGREQSISGIPKNPWNQARVTGGSSSGSGAGLAAGFFFGASGTDGGGSIRAPAALCGVVGLRPTYGLVSTRGILAEGWSSANCAGPMARSVHDVALLLRPLLNVPVLAHRLGEALQAAGGRASAGCGCAGDDSRSPEDYFLDGARCSEDVLESVMQARAVIERIGFRTQPVSLHMAPICGRDLRDDCGHGVPE